MVQFNIKKETNNQNISAKVLHDSSLPCANFEQFHIDESYEGFLVF